jgi:hypothetical protein
MLCHDYAISLLLPYCIISLRCLTLVDAYRSWHVHAHVLPTRCPSNLGRVGCAPITTVTIGMSRGVVATIQSKHKTCCLFRGLNCIIRERGLKQSAQISGDA